MRVVVPFTSLAPETAAALDATGRQWEGRDVSADDCAYSRLLAGLWEAGEAFTIVEHDVIVTAAALGSLEACAGDWCSCPHPYLSGSYAGLGCARFRGPLLARHPDLMAEVGLMSDKGHPPGHWCRQDGYMRAVLMRRGERQCTAHPGVGHPSRSPAHGCVPGWGPRG